MASGIMKLTLVYRHFAGSGDQDIIACVLYYFSITYLWQKETYLTDTFEHDVAALEKENVLLGKLLRLLNCFCQPKMDAKAILSACQQTEELVISQLFSGGLEGGIVGGVLYQLFLIKSTFLPEQCIKNYYFTEQQNRISLIKLHFSLSTVFAASYRDYTKGFLMSFKINLVDTDCPVLSLLATYGTLIHKSSDIFEKLHNVDLFHDTLMVADSGHDFYAIRLNRIIEIMVSRFHKLSIHEKVYSAPLPEATMTDFYQSKVTNAKLGKIRMQLQDELSELREDVEIRDSVIKNKQRQIQDNTKAMSKIPKSTEQFMVQLMVADWTHGIPPYSFDTVSRLIAGKLKGMVKPSLAQLLRYALPFLNVCICQDSLHLFNAVTDRLGRCNLRRNSSATRTQRHPLRSAGQ